MKQQLFQVEVCNKKEVLRPIIKKVMGGYGSSIQTVVSNNKKILRKRSFLNSKLKESDGKLKFDEISNDKLNQIKEEIQRKARKERYRSKILSIVLMIICFLISTYLVFGWMLELIPL